MSENNMIWRMAKRLTVALVTMALVVVGMGRLADPAEAAPKPGQSRPTAPDKMKPVKGHGTKAVAVNADPAAKAALKGNPKVAWPAAGVSEVVPGAKASSAVVRVAGDAKSKAAPGKVRVEVLSHDAATKAGVQGLLIKARRADGARSAATSVVSVDYSGFRNAYGGGWASRLRLTTADGRPLPSRNDPKAGTVTASVALGATDTTLALAAGPEGSTGSYKATTLAESGKWQMSANSGTFSWDYAMRAPQVPGGLLPPLSASYSSAGADGRTVSTNSQPSWLGEGWNLGSGFIERSYKGCADDLGGNNGQTKTGDMCWETENATLSLGGSSSELVHNGGNVWRPEKDDGSRVEHLFGAANGDDNGEYWKVTKTDGTQYFFGRRADSSWNVPVFGNDAGEPCYKADFASSHCVQSYRWNLDHVIDRHGSTINYVYAPEAGRYGMNLAKEAASYTRGGNLLRIEYGAREGQAGVPAKVEFETGDRCIPGANCTIHNAASWPDVPWDQDCPSGPCTDKVSPTFWSTKRLAKVTTYAGAKAVDSWTFEHSFPAPGDDGGAALWLRSVVHRGLAGGEIALPAVTFDGTAYPNRVNSAGDGMPPMNKYRIHAINTESGGTINIKYADPNCTPDKKPTPDSNGLRCFPVRWSMPPSPTPVDDWFHKYVVSEVSQSDRVAGGKRQLTSYSYVGDAAWHYADNPLVAPERRTWSQWRGYERVIVRKGDTAADEGLPQSQTQLQYFRGMNGDKKAAGGTKDVGITDAAGTRLPDDNPYAGLVREEIAYDGVGGPEASATVNDPWRRGPTATQGSLQAFQVETTRTTTRTALKAGGFRRTEKKSTFDNLGRVTKVDDLGDTAKGDDDRCATTSYVENVGTWLMDTPSQITTIGVACGGSPTFPADAISDVRNSYDGGAFGVAPTVGDVTRVEKAVSYDGSTPHFDTVSRATFDGYGRALDTFDALDRKTSTSYTEADGLTTGKKVTNPLGHEATTTVDPVVGQPVLDVDPAGRRTEATYDGLGRMTAAWLPGRAKSDDPTTRVAYEVRNNAPSWVRTESLNANGKYTPSYALLDGFLRARQTQTAGTKGGRILTDTIYDSRGLKAVTREPYWTNSGSPGTDLFIPTDASQLPRQTVTRYDSTERPVASIFLDHNVEKWRTTTAYGGDYVSVDPPTGGTATTTYADAQGQTTELRQYKSGAASGEFDATKYTYTKAGKPASIRDAAGNTWRNEYDVLGRQTKADDPDKGITTMAYDAADQLTSTKDARGSVLVYGYDALGRKTSTRQGSATGSQVASWTYDTLAKGALTSSTRYQDGREYTRAARGFDAAGRPTGETVTIPAEDKGLAGTYTTGVTYKPDGSQASAALPALGNLPAETILNGYNDLGMPTTLKGGTTTYVGTTDYTEINELQQVALGTVGKRVWQTTFYETGTRRLGRSLTQKESDPALVDKLDYSYDNTGNLTSVKDEQPGSVDTQCFRYDYLRRTTDAWTATAACSSAPSDSTVGGPAPYWQSYGYDATGNRTSVTKHGVGSTADAVSAYAYPAAGQDRPHAVQSVTTAGKPEQKYAYDATGNMSDRAGQPMAWGVDGSLAKAGSSTYVYDASGAQLIRRDKDSATLFVGGGELKVDTATGAKRGTRYYSASGANAVRTSAGVVWLASDHHGTSQVAVNESTLASTVRRFDPFGNARGTVTAWPGGSRGFVGGTTNAETGLTRLGAREYDPDLGKFISVDPVIDPADPQQMNGYSYANSNPASSSDPDGLRNMDDCDVNGHCGAQAEKNWPAPPKPRRTNKWDDCDAWGQCGQSASRTVNPAGNIKRNRTIGDQVIKKIKQIADVAMSTADTENLLRTVSKLFSGDAYIKSASFCGEAVASAILSASAGGCLTIDDVGIAVSGGVKLGVEFGGGAAVKLMLKVSTGPATTGTEYSLASSNGYNNKTTAKDINKNLEPDHKFKDEFFKEGGFKLRKPGLFVETETKAAGTNNWSTDVAVGLQWGAHASFGGTYFSAEGGTYVHRW
ncbi:RHS repeat domain-containing protein [Luteipulveratus mongoliensis]|uniref:RHS repeat domain-containing protein n=1 Tax=Luteipulveratus mongoliensis TaxID=571913 RepID=UPI0006973B2C|nr:RHS repeat-associated core domain-containing protein [Luteipulveratus mongoliensis]